MNIEQMTGLKAPMTVLHQLVDVLQNNQLGDLRKAEECFRISAAARDAQWNALIAGQAGEAVAMTDVQIEKLRDATFSINNPFCPVDSKSMRKAVRAYERAQGIKERRVVCPTCNQPPISDCAFANCKREFASLPAPQVAQAGHHEEQPDGTVTPVDPTDRGFKAEQLQAFQKATGCDTAEQFLSMPWGMLRDQMLAVAPSPDGKAEQAEAPSDATCPRCGKSATNIFHHMQEGEDLGTAHCGCLYQATTQPTASNAGEGWGMETVTDAMGGRMFSSAQLAKDRAALASKPVAPPAREALKWPVWQPEHYGTCPARNTPKGECNCYVALSATPPAQAMQDREDEAIYEVRSISFWSGCLTLKRINGDKEVPQSMESGMTVTLRAARARGEVKP